MYTLDPDQIEQTVMRLERRVAERFPGAGLSTVAGKLSAVGQHARERAKEIALPHVGARVVSGVLVLIAVASVAATMVQLGLPRKIDDWAQSIQLVVAGVQNIVFVTAAVLLLFTLEGRAKRRRALVALYELRAIAHLVDVHQLGKHPLSPERGLAALEMARYLGLCDELVTVAAKIAVLYAQQQDDPLVLAATADIERLCLGVSQKIGQKLALLARSASTD
jgi:hypothetical protein